MDALSALKIVPPQYGEQLLNSAKEAGAANAISVPDMEKVSPGISLQPSNLSAPAGQATDSFQNLLGNFVNEVSAQQGAASDAVNGLLSGQHVSLHQAMISMEEASVSFQMMVEVRNKLLDSYQELMRMTV
jgi:flagellar hook-basal body complex protein FliE